MNVHTDAFDCRAGSWSQYTSLRLDNSLRLPNKLKGVQTDASHNGWMRSQVGSAGGRVGCTFRLADALHSLAAAGSQPTVLAACPPACLRLRALYVCKNVLLMSC